MTNDSQQGKFLGEFAAKTLHVKTLAIIDDRTAYGQGLADVVEKTSETAGIDIVAHEYTTDKSTDFMAILTSIKGKNPDAIFFGGMDAQAGPMAKQIKALGISATFFGGDGMQMAEFTSLAGSDSEGVYASSPGMPLDRLPRGKEFSEKFTSKYGKIQLYAPYAYDATMTMIEAMKKADSTEPAKYMPVLASIRYAGITGTIAFDDKGDIKDGSVTMYRVQNGAWTAQ